MKKVIFNNPFFLSLAVVFFLLLFLPLLPIILPVGIFSSWIDDVRKKKSICKLNCNSCGLLLGMESVKLSDEQWKVFVKEIFEQNPSMRFRIHRSVYAVCTNCGCEYNYGDKRWAVVPLEEQYGSVEKSKKERIVSV